LACAIQRWGGKIDAWGGCQRGNWMDDPQDRAADEALGKRRHSARAANSTAQPSKISSRRPAGKEKRRVGIARMPWATKRSMNARHTTMMKRPWSKSSLGHCGQVKNTKPAARTIDSQSGGAGSSSESPSIAAAFA